MRAQLSRTARSRRRRGARRAADRLKNPHGAERDPALSQRPPTASRLCHSTHSIVPIDHAAEGCDPTARPPWRCSPTRTVSDAIRRPDSTLKLIATRRLEIYVALANAAAGIPSWRTIKAEQDMRDNTRKRARIDFRHALWPWRLPCSPHPFRLRPRRHIRTRASASSCPMRRAGCRTRWRASPPSTCRSGSASPWWSRTAPAAARPPR